MNLDLTDLPTLNALLNATSALILTFGYIKIKRRGDIRRHKRLMLAALAVSALFLISYLIYHNAVGSVPYPKHDWTRPLYFAILIPHVILAALMVPFVVAAVILGLRGRYRAHVRITRVLWPVWMFVSASGVAVYLMLYRF